jgi:hypothetical protein
MEGIVLPEAIFGSSNVKSAITPSTNKKISADNKYTKHSGKDENKLKKQETIPNTDSDSEIDVENTYHIKSDSDDDMGKTKNIKKNKILLDNEYNISASPVYDGVEPYFIFKRKWDAFFQNKQNKHIHITILKFLNKLLCTNYMSLISIKKIPFDMIPTSKKFTDLMTSDQDYVETFKIKYKQNIPSVKMIDNLLAKVNFSLIEVDNGNEIYYSIKPRYASLRSNA